MKNSLLCLVLSWLAFASGCRNPTYPVNTDIAENPVARAGGGGPWTANQHFDAGVVLIRNMSADTLAPGTGDALIGMAFDINDSPVQVGGASINDILLTWIANNEGGYYGQSYRIITNAAYGPIDSATFNYSNFNGESWNETVDVAPDFGKLTLPDTVSMSQDLMIKYQNAVPGDSIQLSIQELLTDGVREKHLQSDSANMLSIQEELPDTGVIIVPSAKLPHVSGIDSYIIQVRRFRFSVTLPQPLNE